MRKETIALLEAARGLGVELAPTRDNPAGIRVACAREEFPLRLGELARAVEAFDKAAGQGGPAVVADPATPDAQLMRMALDAVFRWMRGQGMDVKEPHAAVAAVLRGKGGRPAEVLKAIPKFAHDAPRGTRKPKPLLRLEPGASDIVTLNSLRKRNLQADMTLNSMGHAAPT